MPACSFMLVCSWISLWFQAFNFPTLDKTIFTSAQSLFPELLLS